MVYITGTAASFADLKTNIISGCTSNGWSSSGDVLWKGNSYFELTTIDNYIVIYGGTGQSGGVIYGKSDYGARLGGSYFNFPVTYELNIFTDPDEVYAIVNYNSSYYQQMSFGTSDIAGAGFGPWFTAAHNNLYDSHNNGINISSTFNSISSLAYASNSTNSMGLFNKGHYSGEFGSSFIYTDANGEAGWYGYNSGPSLFRLKEGSASWVAGLMLSLPSALTNTNVLLPVKAVIDMSSNGLGTVVNLRNARFCRIDYQSPGDIITLGTEKWKVYPWLKKNSELRYGEYNGLGIPADHSGTLGYAIRYTGS